jgi:hypothetical protein
VRRVRDLDRWPTWLLVACAVAVAAAVVEAALTGSRAMLVVGPLVVLPWLGAIARRRAR